MNFRSIASAATLAVVATCVILGPACVASPSAPTDGGLSCGVYSVAILHKLERGTNDLDRTTSRLDGRQTHSMAELRDASAELGVALQGIALDERDWPLDRPAICFLKHEGTGHFAVIRPAGRAGRLVQVIDAIRGVETKQASAFFSSGDWTGRALVPIRLGDKFWLRAFPTVGWSVACCGVLFLIYKIMSLRHPKVETRSTIQSAGGK